MHYVQYLGPYDTFDVSNLLGKPGMVFHTPTAYNVHADQRGNVIEVTNDAYEQLLTYPNHRFVEVDAAQAKTLIERQKAARKLRDDQLKIMARDSDNLTYPGPSIDDQIAALPTAEPGAASAPATPAQIRAETRGVTTTGAPVGTVNPPATTGE